MKFPHWAKRFGFKSGTSETVTFVQFLQQLKQGKVEYYTDWVYAGFSKIAQSLARVEWELYQVTKGDVNEVNETHPLLGLLYTFNGKTTRYDAIAKTILGFLLDGEVGWYLGEKVGNKPTAIYVVPKKSYKVSSKDNFGYPLTYEINGANNVKIDVGYEDFLVIKNTNPNSQERGFSVLEALRDVAETDYFISRWNKNLMKNDAQPSGVLEFPPEVELSEKEIAIIKKEVNEALAGYENSHKLAFLMKGAKLTNTTLNPKELDFNNGRAFNRDLLLAVIGTPKTLLGLDNGVTKATAETAERIFAKYTLEPIMQQVVEWLNEYLVPKFGDNLWLGFEPMASEDEESKLNLADKGHNRWFTTNETREMYGKEPIAGGDFIYIPLVNMPAIGGEQAKALPEGAYLKLEGNANTGMSIIRKQYIKMRVRNRKGYKNLIAQKVADSTAEKVEQKLSEKRGVLKIRETKSFTKEEKDRMWDGFIARKRAQDDNLKKIFLAIFEREKQIVLNNLNQQGKGADFKIKPSDVLFDKDSEISAAIALIEPQYFALVTEGLTMAAEMLGADALSITDIPAVAEWIKKISERWGTDITENTYSQLAQILQRGIDSGDGVYELGNAIEDYFGTIAPARADTIARTETARAMTASQGFAWEEYGVKKVEWYLAGSDPCPICIGNSAKEWSVEKAKNGTIQYAHPNCECLFLPL